MIESLRRTRHLFALAVMAALVVAAPALAQDDEDDALEIGRWYPSLEAGLFLAQSAYSDNWAGGDAGQIAWTFILNGELKRQLNERWNLHNSLRLAYGQTSTQNADSRQWDEPTKSTDRIDVESILRATLGLWLDPYASLRVESQFQDLSDELGRSVRFNPVFVKEAVGVAHEFYGEEKRQLLLRLGGALRQTFRKQFVSESDPDDDSTMSESGLDGGLELVADYKNVFFDEAVSWTSKATLYKALFYSSKDDFQSLDAAVLEAAGVDPDVADFTTTIDVDWENVFTGQVTDHIAVNLYVRFVYDKYDTSVEPIIEEDMLTNAVAVNQAIRKAGQFKQTLALGITYRFF